MVDYGRGHLSRYFVGVAAKKLSVVETTPAKSNQHEFNGSKPLRQLLGEDDRRSIPTQFVWLGDEQEGISEEGFASWYDSRRAQLHRSAEYRLYYPRNGVSDLMGAGDTLFIAKRPDGDLMIIIAPAGSTVQNQLVWMFGIDEPGGDFEVKEIDKEDAKLDFAARYILDELGIEADEEGADLDGLIAEFTAFPGTKAFSELARKSLGLDPRDDPDKVLMAWLEREELLFRRLERKVVAERLQAGFMAGDDADVDGFISFSLSVQNRRKSRIGYSFESHLKALFDAHTLRYDRQVITEKNSKPDFLFPGLAEYKDASFPETRLTVLGAKSSCKDRWTQVLAEASRIKEKHLVTLEPSISENQTEKMAAMHLRLILPKRLHETYKPKQQEWLMSVADFVGMVRDRQA
jgi:hypothetical protein